MEYKIIEEQKEGVEWSQIHNIQDLIMTRSAKTPDVPADVILIKNLHETFLDDTNKLKSIYFF